MPSSIFICSSRKVASKNFPLVLCFSEDNFCWQLVEIWLPHYLGTIYANWLALITWKLFMNRCSEKCPREKRPPEKSPQENCPPENCPTEICPQENCPLEKAPGKIPPRKTVPRKIDPPSPRTKNVLLDFCCLWHFLTVVHWKTFYST